jgi:hypothetical protein
MNCNGYTFEDLLTKVIWKKWDMEIVGISGTRSGNVGRKFNKIGTKNMKRNITDLHKNMNCFKKGFRPRTKSLVDVKGRLQRISYADY